MKKLLSVMLKILKGMGNLTAIVLCTIGTLLCLSIGWMFDTWSNLTVDEMVYHLKAPLEGTNEGMIIEYINVCLAPAVLVFITALIVFTAFRKKKKISGWIMAIGIILPILGAYKSLSYAWNNLDAGDYVDGQSEYSTFIDNNYVDPRDVSITFPEQKRNLIYIFLESMETTYADTDNGGGLEENVIPELTLLAQENEDFSGEDIELNGGHSMPGTTWTMGALFAQTAGIPLHISIEGNSMDTQTSFFSGAVTMGDILEQEEYSQMLMVGSDATFGGRRLYFTEHGNYDIIDYNSAIDNGWIPEDYRVWWGFEDEKLFGYAKEQILQMADEEEPFNFTMLTVDTHFEDGYVCNICEDTYGDDQYANVISCADRQVAGFVSWIQEQDFYENTTIVVSGDHPTMDADFCEDAEEGYERKVYTTYINPAAELKTKEKRTYSTFDNFPTTLASIGVSIEGERLGLGTNLFSENPTLLERFGIEKAKTEIYHKSKLMDKLADIDEDSDAWKERLKSFQKTTFGVEEYDLNNGYFPVVVKELTEEDAENIESLSIAVWTNEDQSDLQWIPMWIQEDGTYVANVELWGFDYKTGNYNIHLYKTDTNGNSNILGGIVENIQ